jgi:hypothetical protein
LFLFFLCSHYSCRITPASQVGAVTQTTMIFCL